MSLAPTKSVVSLDLTGYKAWVEPLLNIDYACAHFPGYAEALAMIAAKRERLRQLDLTGPIGKTAGWSPSGNFKQDAEFPYHAALLLKTAFGDDALRNKRKRHLILQLHPEFSLRIKR